MQVETERELRRIELARLGTFVVASVLALLRNELPLPVPLSVGLAGVGAVLFLVLVVRHRRLRPVARRAEIGATLARMGSHRLARQWEELAEAREAVEYEDPLLDPGEPIDEDHPYVADLDVFGPASLRALLGVTPTPSAVRTLRAWLSDRAAPDTIRERQRAVLALAADFEGREALETEALLVPTVGEDALVRFHAWLGEESPFGRSVPPWSGWAARLLPPVTLTLLILDVGVGLSLSAWSWGVPLAIQSVLAWRWGTSLAGFFGRGSSSGRGIRRYHDLLSAWQSYPCEDVAVRDRQARLRGEGGRGAAGEIRRLQKWLDAADSRASMLHVFVAMGLLWDIHVAWGLDRWRREAGSKVPTWLDVVGELQALSALSVLAHDHPDWVMPTLVDGEPRLSATELGHPLIPESVLRRTDVTVDPPGRFLLVTGSNMAGKSTLLRSIGLAAVMAQSGSVVCAHGLEMTPLRVFTSMRIHDSLTAGVSLFMAELNRLKALVDAARVDESDRAVPSPSGDVPPTRGDSSGPIPLLYLVDEVLQGTNSDERRIAARRIVTHLLDAPAIGAVTTHDLTLHEDSRLDEAATKVHFRETVSGGKGGAVLTFDYRLRPGLATSRNALKLLEIVGLGEDG